MAIGRNFKKNTKGVALISTIIIISAVIVIAGSLLNWGISEQTINERHIVRIETQNAVESILESGVAQLVSRWIHAVSFPNNQLAEENFPLTILSFIPNFYLNTPIEINNSELIGGLISEPKWAYIDPTDPQNEFDSQKGKNVLIREVLILAKATGNMLKGPKINVYGKQTLQVRDAPLFTHAVFYNMDLEYHPGPTMHMYGPVHTNGNLYASAVNNLYFHSTVTTAKNYYHGLSPNHPESAQSGKVWFKNKEGTFITDYKGSGSPTDNENYYDSNQVNFRQKASNLWEGNLQTQEHGIAYQSPIGYKDYVRDDPSTPEIDDDLNYAYAIIEPNLKVKDTVNHPNYKGEGEKQKYARKASLIIRLHKSATPPTPLAYQLSTNYFVSFHKLKRVNATNPNSEPVLSNENDLIEENVQIDPSYVPNILNMSEYTENGTGTPITGLYDLRRNQGLDILELDVNNFRSLIDDTDEQYDPNLWQSNYVPANDYNGVVYVEFPYPQSDSGRADKIVVSDGGLGLMLKNAQNIPNPSYNSNNSLRDPGFTLATNNTLYVKGHFNADGDPNTGSATHADNPNEPEPPASLIADAITFLSNNWNVQNSKNANKNMRPATFTEVNAALIQGLIPTGKGGENVQSGGNHNFPRFLENWSGQTFRYRGSLVALFENEIVTAPHKTTYYSPPIRDWGYYDQLGIGIFPPGTPNVRSFNKINFSFIDSSTYLSLKNQINASFN